MASAILADVGERWVGRIGVTIAVVLAAPFAVAACSGPEDTTDIVSQADGGDAGPGTVATGDDVAGRRCAGVGYELTPPPGWFPFECRWFSPQPITVDPATCGCQFPIDAAVADSETHDEALARIRSRSEVWDIRSEESMVVDGRTATLLDTLVEVDGRTVDRRLVVVDLGSSTLFLAATDEADQAPGELDYGAVLGGLDAILGSIALDPR